MLTAVATGLIGLGVGIITTNTATDIKIGIAKWAAKRKLEKAMNETKETTTEIKDDEIE